MFTGFTRQIGNRDDHYAEYYREVAELQRHLELIDMWHGVPIRIPNNLHRYVGSGWKYIVRNPLKPHQPPCFYKPGPGITEHTPAPSGGGATGDAATTTDSS